MFDDLPLVIVVCAFSLVCIGTLAIGGWLLLGISPTGLMERFANISDDETPGEDHHRRGRRRGRGRGGLRSQAQSVDFDEALARKMGGKTPSAGTKAEDSQQPRLRRGRPSLSGDESGQQGSLRGRRRHHEVDPDEVRDILDDEGEDFL